jgi:hypothetical protein
LLFGTNVREYGQHIGRLTAFEVDPTTRTVQNVVLSGGEAGGQGAVRPFDSLLIEPGDLEIRPYTSSDKPSGKGVLLSHATRVERSNREIGHLIGIDVAIETGHLDAIIGRRSWWARRFRFEGAALDLSVPGEVRVSVSTTQAA